MTEPRQIRDPHPQPRIDQPGRQGGNQSNLIPINPKPLILSITVASHQLENRTIEIIDIHGAQRSSQLPWDQPATQRRGR